MTTISMTPIKEAVSRTLGSKNTEKAAYVSLQKAETEGRELLANSQEALAAQGKVNVKKPYQKPEMQVVKIEKENTKAASGEGWDVGGEDDYGTGGNLNSDFARSSNTGVFDSSWETW